MKIICDCGRESNFISDETWDELGWELDEGVEAVKFFGEITLYNNCDGTFIRCSCGKKIFCHGFCMAG